MLLWMKNARTNHIRLNKREKRAIENGNAIIRHLFIFIRNVAEVKFVCEKWICPYITVCVSVCHAFYFKNPFGWVTNINFHCGAYRNSLIRYQIQTFFELFNFSYCLHGISSKQKFNFSFVAKKKTFAAFIINYVPLRKFIGDCSSSFIILSLALIQHLIVFNDGCFCVCVNIRQAMPCNI